MFRLYSKGCEYAIRALQYFPAEADSHVAFGELCRKARIPLHFGRKMFRTLVEAKILEAVTGPRGGYRFRRPPDSVSLLEVIHAIDGDQTLDICILGKTVCDPGKFCALHETWVAAKEKLLPELKAHTLADLMRKGDGAFLGRRKRGSR